MKGLIFTYALTYGGALLGLFRPFWGLLIYICFDILKPDVLWSFSVPIGNYSRIVAIALLIGWGLHGFGTWSFGRAKLIVALLITFVAWAAVLILRSQDQELAWRFVEEHLKMLLPFLVGITTINSVRQLRQLAWVVVLSQGYLAFEFNLSYYQGFNRVREIGFCGLDNNCIAITMDSCIGVAFFLGLHAVGWWRKALAFGSALLMAHVVMFSFSRGGLLGLILVGGVSFLMIPKRPVYYVALLIAVLIGVRLAGQQVMERFDTAFAEQQDLDGSAQLRLKHWRASVDSMLETPLGVGPSQWRFAAPAYDLPSMEAHSYWLQTGAELGFPGLTLVASFYGLCIVRLWRLARTRAGTDPWPAYLAQMVVPSLVGFAISSQFVSLTGIETPFHVALIGVGVIKLVSLAPAPTLAPLISTAPRAAALA
jgi:probable O-glycosylation ligase (exosortase A-associated)